MYYTVSGIITPVGGRHVYRLRVDSVQGLLDAVDNVSVVL